MKIRALIASAALLWAGTASADLIFTLDTGNSAISGNTGPYAQVTVHLVDSTNATITFDSLCTGGVALGDPGCTSNDVFLMGDGSTVAVNVNATSFTLGSITGTNTGTGFTSPPPYSDGGSGNVNGFGTFNQTINSFDGFTHSSDEVSFALTNTGGTWADVNSVLAENSNGALAAAHIFVTAFPANAANGAIVTGFAAGNGTLIPPEEIPEPGILALLSVALLGMGFIAMRRRS